MMLMVKQGHLMMLGYQSQHRMMHNFIADFRKGGDLLKSFEQINLVKQFAFFHIQFVKGQSSTSSRANCVHELFLESCLLDYCVITQNPDTCGRGL